MVKYLSKHPWRLILAIVVNILAAIVLVAYSYVLELITNIATGVSSWRFELAVPTVIGYLVVQALTDSAAEYMNKSLAARIGAQLRSELFARYHRLRPLHFYQKQVGQYVAQLTKQVDVVTQSYFQVILRAIYLVSLLVFAVLGTFLISPVITVGVALLSVPALVFPFLVKKWLESAKSDVVVAIEKYTSAVTDMLAGFTTIQYTLSVPPFTHKHEQLSQSVQQMTIRDVRIQKITNGVSDFLGDVMYLGAWLLGAYFVRTGEISLGQLVAFSQLASLFNWPMAMLTELLAEFYGGRKQALEIAAELAKLDDGKLITDDFTLPESQNRPLIELHQVNYEVSGRRLLTAINLHFDSDKKYLIVGASGSGKTTLVRMLMGELVPTTGAVQLYGKQLSKFNRGIVYQTIGIMTQKPDIFSGTIRENVSLFDSKIADDRIIAALKKAGLGQWLSQHDLETKISAETPLLSGGEKQRLALARLLLRDCSFMIFDELATGLDPRIAAQLQADLLQMHQGFILITHQYDRATFAQADEIIVLEKGQVVAKGKHAEPAVVQALNGLKLG